MRTSDKDADYTSLMPMKAIWSYTVDNDTTDAVSFYSRGFLPRAAGIEGFG